MGLHAKPIIIGVGGGYPAGAFHDIVVARRDVVPLMQGNERGIADHGYHDDRYHDAVEDKSLARKRLDPTLVAAYEQAMKFVSGRHEHVNAELKEFAVLRERFRHDPVLHPVCFRAIASFGSSSTRPSSLLPSLHPFSSRTTTTCTS
jgi:hypothetical protein